MTMMEERRKVLEDKYILDFERSFKTRERRNRMLAEWAATLLGRNDVSSYIDSILALSIRSPRDDVLVDRIAADLKINGRSADEHLIREKMHELMYEAAEALDREAQSAL